MLRVLGPLEVDGPDGPVSVGGQVPRRILSALLVTPGAVVLVDRLVDAAWGDDPPPSAERTLVSHITRLREALLRADPMVPAQVERRGSGYRLVVAPENVDASRLEQILDGVKDLSSVGAVTTLGEALALWRAPAPFADLQATTYPAAEAARLIELYGSAIEALVRAHLEVGDPASAAVEAEARLSDDPYREQLWELLIVALYRQGRQADALEAYQRARLKLTDELGVDPGPRLRRLEEQVLAQDPALLVIGGQNPRPCPYRGLARYDVSDAELFVGRERLVNELVARLVDERMLIVVGPSGAGKSSLVRAGLVPALTGGSLPGSATWSVAMVVPGTEPLEALAVVLADRPDVLVVDQAEEALLAEDGSFVVPFGDRVLSAVDAGTRVVLVLRADFFGLLSGHPVLARRAGPATVLVGAPDERELRRIITEPAAKVGLRVEPTLADLVVAEVRDRPGVLPVLSTALVRTWEHRDGDLLTLASYQAGGGVAAALQRVGEEAWAALDDEAQRSACRRLLLRLGVDEDGSWVRRWVRRSELVRRDDPAGTAALAVLTDHRLVVARADDLGIAHEALLTGWPRLHGWLEEGRSSAAVRERLSAAATAWEEADHDQGELYRGTRLQAALDTAAASPEDLTSLERAFLAESADEADRQLAEQRARADEHARGRRRARLVAAGLAVLLAFAASAGSYAIAKQRQAARAAVSADASRLGALARAGGDYDRSLLLAAQAVTLDPSPTTESDLFATLLRGDAVIRALRAPGRVPAITFVDDRNSIVALTYSGALVKWSVHGGAKQTTLNLGPHTGRVDVAENGQFVVDRDARLEVVDPDNGRRVALGPDVGTDPGVSIWSMSRDRTSVVLARGWTGDNYPPEVLIWRLGTRPTDSRRVPVGERPVRIAACGDQTMCVLTEGHRLVRVRLSDAVVVGSFALPADTLDSLAASADGSELAVAGADAIVRILDARSGRVVRELGGASRDPRVLGFSPDGTQIAAGDGATVLVWRTDRSGLPQRYDAHGGRVLSADWAADGSTLASGAEDGTVILWDTAGRRSIGAVLNDSLGEDTSTLWATRQAIVIGQYGGRLLFVDPRDGTIRPAVGTAPGIGDDLYATARSGRHSHRVVTADRVGVTAVWDATTRRLLGTVDLPAPDYAHAADTWVSPDGTRAATIRNDDGPLVFDVATRQVVAHPRLAPKRDAGQDTVLQGWSADSRSLLISRLLSESGNDLLVVDASSGALRLRVPTGDLEVGEVTADPTGRFLAIGMNDGTLWIVDVADGHRLAPPLPANPGTAFNVSISPNGRYIAVSGYPPGVTVWDTRTFRQVAGPLPLDTDALDARARFSPDGRLVVTSGQKLRVFTINPTQWLARACREAGRTLTRAEFEEVLPGRPYRPACT